MALLSYPWFGASSVGHLELGLVSDVDVSRVSLTLSDGATVNAQLDVSSAMPQGTIFWATVPAVPVSITVYNKQGATAHHEQVTPCLPDEGITSAVTVLIKSTEVALGVE